MTVLRTSHNTWTYDYWFRGKRFRKRYASRSSALKAEAQHRLGQGSNSNQDERVTFQSAAQLFFENHSKPSKRVWKDDKGKIEYLNVLFGEKKLTDFTSLDIQNMRNCLQEKGLAPATIDKYHALVKTIFNKMKQWKKFGSANPACEVQLKREPNAHIRYLTQNELRSLEEHLKNDVIFPYYLAALHTGMRRSELCGMKWEHINLTSRDIYVPISKSGKARHIPMNDVMYMLLTKLSESGTDPQGHVLNRLHPDYISHRFIRKCKKLGINGCRFHDLRHTFASYLVMAGVNIHVVSKWLGHATIGMTEKHYTHLSPDYQREEIQRLNSLSFHLQETENRTNFRQTSDFLELPKLA